MKCECQKHSPLNNISPQISAAYDRFIAARTNLLNACNQDRQLEIAGLDESAWHSYEDEILSKIQDLSEALERLARIPSQTINDLALKITATSRNDYVTEAVKREIEKDLESISQISPVSLAVDAVRLQRSGCFDDKHCIST